jgi:hypothetical protein
MWIYGRSASPVDAGIETASQKQPSAGTSGLGMWLTGNFQMCSRRKPISLATVYLAFKFLFMYQILTRLISHHGAHVDIRTHRNPLSEETVGIQSTYLQYYLRTFGIHLLNLNSNPG